MSDQPLRPIWEPDDFADTVRDAAQHRAYSSVPADLLDDADYLDYLDAAPPIAPPAGFYPRTEPVGMRPGRARLIGRALVAAAVLVVVLTAAVLWAMAVPQ